MQRYSDCPQILRDFLTYHETIMGQSTLTINEYYLDLRMFLRFILLMRNDMPIHTRLDDISIKDVDIPKEQKILDLIDLVSLMHSKTTHYKEVVEDEYKKIYSNSSSYDDGRRSMGTKCHFVTIFKIVTTALIKIQTPYT